MQKPVPGISLRLKPKHINLVATIHCIAAALPQPSMPQAAHKSQLHAFLISVL